MTNIYEGPVLKIVGKIILTSLVYGLASAVTQRIWR